MATTAPVPTRSTSRRVGAGGGLVVNLLLIVLVNWWPGWDAVPFLTPAFADVLPWVNASLVVAVVVNLFVAARGSRAAKAAGDAVTSAVGFAVLVRMWQVFPFDVSDGWRLLIRVLLAVSVFGCVVAFVAAVVTLLAPAARRAA